MEIIRGTVSKIIILLTMMLQVYGIMEVFSHENNNSLPLNSVINSKFSLTRNKSATSTIKETVICQPTSTNILPVSNYNSISSIPEYVKDKLESLIICFGSFSWVFQYKIGVLIQKMKQEYFFEHGWSQDHVTCENDFVLTRRYDPIYRMWVPYITFVESYTDGYSCDNIPYIDATKAGQDRIEYLLNSDVTLADNIGFSFNYSTSIEGGGSVVVKCRLHHMQNVWKLYGVENILCNNTWEETKSKYNLL
ncbi:uncharacterized protein KABA2_07S07876 [Maudiozyma barnettii]|uniref:Uncharacterized protein n=1 Tax=Maudiozyma barnettii TaxID=61262 RepID=A0A8H2ZII1_9SACH|nr:hypothetical protein, no similarity [Kazachstania barnettii]CAB4255938.1 hypothetical protein, no similarity [Kazachstania barnettii]